MYRICTIYWQIKQCSLCGRLSLNPMKVISYCSSLDFSIGPSKRFILTSRGLPFSGGSLSDLPRIRVNQSSKCCFYTEYAYLILTIWSYPLFTSFLFDRKDEHKRFSQLENSITVGFSRFFIIYRHDNLKNELKQLDFLGGSGSWGSLPRIFNAA